MNSKKKNKKKKHEKSTTGHSAFCKNLFLLEGMREIPVETFIFYFIIVIILATCENLHESSSVRRAQTGLHCGTSQLWLWYVDAV